MRPFLLTLLILLMGTGPRHELVANDPSRPAVSADSLTVAISHGKALLELSRYDQALTVFDSLHHLLYAAGLPTSAGALRVRLHRARAFERTNRFDEATEELLHLLEDSRQEEAHGITAEALLLMALIYEEADRPANCQTYLRKARSLIGRENLDHLRSRLEIRTASYHRLYGDTYRARLFARRALAYAEQFEQTQQVATAHLVLSLLYRDSDLDKSERHLLDAARIYRLEDNPREYIVVMLNLANVQYRYGRIEESLATNDSILAELQSAPPPPGLVGYLGPTYYSRAKALRALERYDSAFYYLERGREEELAYLKRATDVRVLEIEARYNEEESARLIEQQEQQLAFSQRRKRLVTWLMCVALAGLIVTLYSYLRVRRANRELGAQSQTIRSQNQRLAASLREQRLLQGEVHHRVRNNLQIVISLLDLQREETDDRNLRRYLESMAGRVYSMAAIHEVLYQEGMAAMVDLRQYVEKLCHYFNQVYREEQGVDYAIDIEDCLLNLETAVPLGTMLNELLTNSFKHASVPGKTLAISISVAASGDTFTVTYRDNGPGYAGGELAARSGGLGNYLLRGMTRQLNGRVSSYNRGGAVTVITFTRKSNASVEHPPPSLTHSSIR